MIWGLEMKKVVIFGATGRTAILSMPVLKIVGLFVNGNKESSMLFVSW